jgi:adenine-specific DNA-methyltransferase
MVAHGQLQLIDLGASAIGQPVQSARKGRPQPSAHPLRLRLPLEADEDPEYLTRQLITYLGNKRTLLGPIGEAVDKVKKRLGASHLRILDAFSGSGVVSRFFKRHAGLLISNDFEDYAAVIGRCFLQNRSSVDLKTVADAVESLNGLADRYGPHPGFIERLYSPRDDESITRGERAFYTKANGRRLDNYSRLIRTLPAELRDYVMAPLLSEASVHANTSGVFKGFHKNPETGIGQFGGGGKDALLRILGEIRLEVPKLSLFECDVDVRQEDANALVGRLPEIDLAYIDPPYNQHPYGSNYFMLNLLVHYEEPKVISRVSGIPEDWRRSDYNVRSLALSRLRELVTGVDSRFLLISFNDEGYITPDEMGKMLERVGKVETIEYKYNTYRGSRNLSGRATHVTELMFLVEKA